MTWGCRGLTTRLESGEKLTLVTVAPEAGIDAHLGAIRTVSGRRAGDGAEYRVEPFAAPASARERYVLSGPLATGASGPHEKRDVPSLLRSTAVKSC